MESDNTRHACVYAHMALAHCKRFELTPLEFQTLDFVLQERGLQGEICHPLVGKGFSSGGRGRARPREGLSGSMPRIP